MAKDSFTTGMDVADMWDTNKVYRSLLKMNLDTKKGLDQMAKKIYKTHRAQKLFKEGFNSQMEYNKSKKE